MPSSEKGVCDGSGLVWTLRFRGCPDPVGSLTVPAPLRRPGLGSRANRVGQAKFSPRHVEGVRALADAISTRVVVARRPGALREAENVRPAGTASWGPDPGQTAGDNAPLGRAIDPDASCARADQAARASAAPEALQPLLPRPPTGGPRSAPTETEFASRGPQPAPRGRRRRTSSRLAPGRRR